LGADRGALDADVDEISTKTKSVGEYRSASDKFAVIIGILYSCICVVETV
jgi:hypothetical protein